MDAAAAVRLAPDLRDQSGKWPPVYEHPVHGSIAELLDAGHPLDKELSSTNRPGKIGYAMTVTLSCTSPDLYIKAQFLGVYILGRSFHYSDY